MVREHLRKIMFLVLGLVAIACVLKYNVVETSGLRFEKVIAKKRPLYKTEVSAQEVADILQLWPKFRQADFSKDVGVSYSAEPVYRTLSWPMKKWFIYHLWDANRFFYVQQRVVSILRYLEVERSANAVINQLKHRRDRLGDDLLLRRQHKQLTKNNFTKDEINAVKEHEKELRQMFQENPA